MTFFFVGFIAFLKDEYQFSRLHAQKLIGNADGSIQHPATPNEH